MRRALFLLAVPLLMAAAPQDGWQKAVPENAAPPAPQLRPATDIPTARPDPVPAAPAAGWDRAGSNIVATSHNGPPPPLRTDLPTAPRVPLGFGQKVNLPGGITGSFDMTYETWKGFRPLTLDLYQPPSRNYRVPLVVFVHGDSDARHAAVFPDLPATMAGLAAQGYVVASVNYRLSGEARFPAAVQDINAAIRFLRAHANDIGFDASRVALWGVSTGGQLAALAGTGCGAPLFSPGGPSDNACVQAVVDWYGPVETASDDLLGCDAAHCAAGAAQSANPLTYVSAKSPPFLIEQGGADTLAPPAGAQKLQAALKAANVAAALVVFPDVGHDFVQGRGPDPAITRQALQKLAAFLGAVFPPSAAAGGPGPPGRGAVYQ